MKDKVLLVEDEADLAMIVSETLMSEGFDVTVAKNGEDGLTYFKKDGADIVVADVMMPVMDGFTMGRKIRAISSKTPLLFLTARGSIDDVVEGFEIGANDYLKKPFKMIELIVRIKALLRRFDSEKVDEETYRIGKYGFNASTQTLASSDISVVLSNIETQLLLELVQNVGKTVDASWLMEKIWQRDDIYNRNCLHGFVHKLRCYLSDDGSVSIINQRGRGYRLVVKSEIE